MDIRRVARTLIIGTLSLSLTFLWGCSMLEPYFARGEGPPPAISPPKPQPLSSSPPPAKGASLAATQEKPPIVPPITIKDYILGPEDLLDISVWNHKDLDRIVPIRPDGKISYPLIGDVQASGLTVVQLRDSITEKLAEFVRNPQVTVIVKEFNSKKVYLLGQVTKPGLYRLRAEVTLLEALSMAEGFTKDADLTGAYLSRNNQVLPVSFRDLLVKGDMAQNVIIQPNDVIFIPSVLENRVYVLGEVRSPGAFEIRGDLSLIEAISRAGDFTIAAVKDEVKIIRGDLKAPEIMTVDMKEVLKGDLARNIPLKPGDIIYVPPTRLAQWNRFVEQLLPTIIAINAGRGAAVAIGAAK